MISASELHPKAPMNVTLTCRVQAHPSQVKWQWFKGSEKNVLSATNELIVFVTRKARYRCVATNSAGSKENSIEISTSCKISFLIFHVAFIFHK